MADKKADKKQVRLTGPGGTVVRVSEEQAEKFGRGWSAAKAEAKAAKPDSK